jgi:hypothetical protein
MQIEFCPKAGWDGEDLIRVFGGTREEFAAFCAVLHELADGEGPPLELEAIPGFEGVGGIRVVFQVGARSRGLRRVREDAFDCELDREGWRTAAERAEGVAENLDVSSFNWLIDGSEVSLLLSVKGAW